jgi:hypothetical protein
MNTIDTLQLKQEIQTFRSNDYQNEWCSLAKKTVLALKFSQLFPENSHG